MNTRPIPSALKTYLEENKPYIIAHLIKFERPIINSFYHDGPGGKVEDYVYLTDAGRDITFDDGSFSEREQLQLEKDSFLGNTTSSASPNGPQVYRSNKLTSVGTINEGIEAKASTLQIKLDAGAIGQEIYITGSMSQGSGILNSTTDISEFGIKEGDKIRISLGQSDLVVGGGQRVGDFIVNRFDGFNNVHLTLTSGSSTLNFSSKQIKIEVLSEDTTTLVTGSDNVSYTNYINREVYIYRVYIDPETNSIVGGEPAFYSGIYDQKGAVLLFKGIITSGAISDNPGSKKEMTWTLTSHWGDFVQVQNRTTSDDTHRALNQDGIPDRDVILKQSYASDLGFEHSERSLNLMATYDREVIKHKLKKKKKNLGLSTKYTMQEYTDYVPTDVDLRLNLQAKALPVIYGVQRVESIPIFFDNQKNKTDHIYAGYAICEGSIGGIYDIIIDGKTTICTDAADKEARNSQNDNNSIDVLCKGRADIGQVLEGVNSSTGSPKYVSNVYSYDGATDTALNGSVAVENSAYYEQNTQNLDAGGVGYTGILHEKTYAFRDPIDSTFIFHSGKSNQRADNLLVEKASKQLFKIQNDFYEGQAHKYWTPNHRLLDTAYCVGEFVVGDGEIQLPELTFLVRGRDINCYNYDDSYMHNPRSSYASEVGNVSQFKLGDVVAISGTGISSYNTTIIDKFSFYDAEGVLQYRFRFETPPTNPSYEVIMTKGSYSWHMLVSDALVATGVVSSSLGGTITSFTGSGSTFAINIRGTDSETTGLDHASVVNHSPYGSSEYLAQISFQKYTGSIESGKAIAYSNLHYSSVSLPSGGSDLVLSGFKGVQLDSADISTLDYNVVFVRNAINVDLKDSSDNDFRPADDRLEGHKIVLTSFQSNGRPYTQERTIISWLPNGGSHDSNAAIAFVDQPWDLQQEPTNAQNQIVQIRTPEDKRVSLNPSLQLLDYLKSERYGKGLKNKDVDLETFRSAARECDTRSDVSIMVSTSGITVPSVDDVYKLENNGRIQFQGTVKSVRTLTISTGTFAEITFKDCIGKIVYKYTGANYGHVGEVYWRNSGGITLRKINSDVTLNSDSAWNSLPSPQSSDLELQKVSGSGASTIALDIGTAGYQADGNPIVKRFDSVGGTTASGYSLYDSDNIKYWKYCGWDSPEQRNVTRHQFNQLIDTSTDVFSNVNNMLRQFNGVLRYSNGKYQLDVKSAVGTLDSSQKLVEDDIIGSVKISDKGSKKTYNSVTANIIDPSQNFQPRSISFFNSDFLKQDNGVPKKGSFETPSITNYYNARVNIKQFLNESRNGLEIQFKVRPSVLSLQAGQIISLEYPRLKWNYEKLFRITNINFLNDGTATITAIEHQDSAYLILPDERTPEFIPETGSTVALANVPESPYSLSASQDESGGIQLDWLHTPKFNPATFDTEIFRNTINSRSSTLVCNNASTDSNPLNVMSFSSSIVIASSPIAVGMVVKNVTARIIDSGGDFEAGELYTIETLGDTPWHNITGVGVLADYSIGDSVIPLTGQTGGGTSGTLKRVEQEVKIQSIDLNANTITLSRQATWDSGLSVQFFAPKIATVDSENTYIDPIIGQDSGNVTRYYWIRYKIKKAVGNVAGVSNKVVFSNFHPLTNNGGATGVGTLIDVDEVRDFNLTFGGAREFVYNTAGNQIETNFPASCTISVHPINSSGTETFQFKVLAANGNQLSTTGFTGSSSFTFTPPTGGTKSLGFDLMPRSVEITFVDTVGQDTFQKIHTVDFTASRIIIDGNDGLDSIRISNDNPLHTFPVALDGTIDRSGSGFNFQVFEGGTALEHRVANNVGNGQYSVVLTSTSVTPGSLGGLNTTTATVLDHGLLNTTVLDGTVNIAVTGKRIDGTSFSETFKQVLNVINPAQNAVLSVNNQLIEYNKDGLSPSPSSTTITVDTFGIPTPFIDLKITDSAVNPTTTALLTNQAVSSNTHSATVNLNTYAINLSDTPLVVEVNVYEANNSQSNQAIVASDKLTIAGIKNGTTNSIVFAYKRAASAPNDNPGTCTVSLETGKITTANLSNSWGKEPPATGNNPIYFVAATAAGNGATDTINASEWTTPALLSASAKTNVVTADSLVFTKAVDTTISPASATITAQTQNTTQNGSWTTSSGALTNVVNTHTGPSCTVAKADFVDGMEVTYTLHSDDGSIADSVVLQQLNDGSQAIQAVLSNATHVLPSATNGVVSSHTGSGTNLQVFEGANELTFTTGTIGNSEYQVSVGNTANITEGTAQAATGQVFCEVTDHSATAAGTDTYIITYTITGKDSNGTSFTTTVDQTLSKAKDGVTGTSVATAFIYKRTSNSTAPALPTGNTTFTFADGSMSFTTANGWDEDIPNTAGRYLWISRATASATGGTASVIIPDSDWGNVELFAHDPVDTINAVLTNPYQDVGISKDNERVFNGTDTNLQIFEGSTVLTPVASNPGNGEYTVAVTSTGGVDTFNVTANEISSNPDKITAPDITTLTDNVGTRKFNCTGKRLTGESFTNISVEQHFKATNVVGTFSLEPGTDGIIVQFPREGDRISAPTDTLQVRYEGFDLEDGATYTLERRIITPGLYAGILGTSTITSGSSSSSFSNSFPTQFTGYPYTYRVNLKRTDPTTLQTTTLTSDQIVYYATRDGAKGESSVAAALSNESHNIPRNADFDVIMDNTGTDIQIQEGAQFLDYVASNPGPGQFSVTATGNGGITPGSISLISNPNVLGANPLNLLSLPMSEAFELQDFDGDGQLDSWKFSSAINNNTNTVIADAIDAPIVVQGGSKGERLQAPSGTSYGEYSIRARNHEGVTITGTGEYWFSAFVKAGDLNYIDTPNLITNGDFNNNANNWSLSGNFSWHSSGRIQRVSGSSNSYFSQDIDIVEGKTYRVRYDVEHTGGNTTTNQYSDWSGTGSANHGSSINGSGSVDITITAGQTATIPFKLYGIGNFRGYFDNVRIEEVSVGTDHVFLRTTADQFQSFVEHEAVFDLTNGNVQSYTTNTDTYISNAGLPTGWYRIGIRVQHSAAQVADTSNQSRLQFIIGLSDSTGARTFTNVNSINAYLWGAMINAMETASSFYAPEPYQVNTGSIARVADHTEAVGGITSNSPSVDYQIDAVGIGGGYLGTIVKKQTFSVINPAASVRLTTNVSVVQFDASNANPVPNSLTYTANVTGLDPNNVHYRFNINNAGGSAFDVSTQTTNNHLSELNLVKARFPKTITCSVYSGTTTNQGTLLVSDTITIIAATPTSTVTVSASNGSHIFEADDTGLVSLNDFSTTFSVVISGTTYSYDQSYPYTADSYRYGPITNTDANVYATLVNTSGVLTVDGNSSLLTAQINNLSDQIKVPIIDNTTGSTIGVYIVSLSKRIGSRSIQGLSKNLGSTENAFMLRWREGSITSADSIKAIDYAIAQAPDSTVRPGDHLILDHNAGTGTRIYQGIVRTASTGALSTEWSTPVVKTIAGSMVVEGSLSAAALATNTVFTKTLRVNNSITVGLNTGTSSTARINSFGKTSFADSTSGFFLGRHGNVSGTSTPAYSFDVGNNTNHLRFNGQTGAVSIASTTGGFSLKSGTSGARLEIVNDQITIRDSSNNIRVRIGAL